MVAGLGHLGLAPREFWAMTPRELDAALRGHYGLGPAGAALTRRTLETLLANFPDDKGHQTVASHPGPDHD
jgi:uncharacterized phage protein (TIGR02216 family)